MSERFRRIVDAVVETVKRPVYVEVLAIVVVVAASLFFAGLVYGFSSGVVIGVAFLGDVIRVFYPDQRIQTVAEMLVTSTFYLLGFAGFLLYGMAYSKRFTPRASQYMLVFSGLLIVLAALGLIGGYLSKTG
ncbi:MAG: hypothetical protein QXF45_05035 [Candidatus Caldarchaeum sp.]